MKIKCPKCNGNAKITRTVRTKDNRFTSRYYKCDSCNFTFNSKERSQVKLTIFDRDHLVEDLCHKINLEFAKTHGEKLLRQLDLITTLDIDPDDFDNELQRAIEKALTGQEFYDFVKAIFLQSLDRFEVLDTNPVQMYPHQWDMLLDYYQLKGIPREQVLAMKIHFPDLNSPYIIDPDNPPVFFLLSDDYIDNKAKYLINDQIEKDAFPKKPDLELKSLKRKKLRHDNH